MAFAHSWFSDRSRGFTVIELVVIVAVVAILAAVSIPVIQPIMQSIRLENALDKTSMELRRARQSAVDYRRIHRVQFQGGAIRLERQESEGGWSLITEVGLPRGIEFAIPVSGSLTLPDGVSASQAVDFDGQNWVMFFPDGSARGNGGAFVNGAVFVSRNDDPSAGHAVSIFGATGRIRAWRLQEAGSGMEWK